jgi:hypothetical protein
MELKIHNYVYNILPSVLGLIVTILVLSEITINL